MELPKLIPYKTIQMDVAEEGERYILAFENQFQLKVTVRMKELLAYLNGTHTIEYICERVKQEMNLIISPQELEILIESQLKPKGVLVHHTVKAKHESAIMFRTPLFKGVRLKRAVVPFYFLFGKTGTIISFLGISIAIALFMYHFQEFQLVSHLGSVNQVVVAFVLFIISLFLHELGHIVAAFRYGIVPRDVGVGLYMLMPAFFVDLSELWQIPRSYRVVVNVAGVYFQLICFGILEVLLLLTNYQAIAIANVMILTNVLLNLNPLLRYDGFWILTDIMGIANLHPRAKKMVIYYFKGYILGKDEFQMKYKDVLVAMTSRMQRIFLLYAVLYTIAIFFVLTIVLGGLIRTVFIADSLSWENSRGIVLILGVIFLRTLVLLCSKIKVTVKKRNRRGLKGGCRNSETNHPSS
ncbi:hypothetical protein [Brevibacillus laterosporus]|uniref:hypothetical protein n=1 Tax=Brevibacillus laterosporus TaxID=1465 RepID=UPI000B9A3D67|nr:hypothetical protein [Brevibacillus laterosporus]